MPLLVNSWRQHLHKPARPGQNLPLQMSNLLRLAQTSALPVRSSPLPDHKPLLAGLLAGRQQPLRLSNLPVAQKSLLQVSPPPGTSRRLAARAPQRQHNAKQLPPPLRLQQRGRTPARQRSLRSRR